MGLVILAQGLSFSVACGILAPQPGTEPTSSVDGHLGCLRVSAVVDSASVHIVEHVSFQIMFCFPDICPRVGLQSHRITLFLVF